MAETEVKLIKNYNGRIVRNMKHNRNFFCVVCKNTDTCIQIAKRIL